ncbi:hypothetical protein AGMMS49546_31760 [Spirochaetia bacterium]|nr:hypothetical protein AGMMS49546_31760 [Spirochaetia bacterium]
MKRFTLFLAVLVGISTLFIACPESGPGGGQTLTYTRTDGSGNTYKLIVIENTGRAAYAAQVGDTYELTITSASGVVKISRGTVQAVSGDSLTLKPSYASESPSFSVTVTGESIGTITGTITLIGGETEAPPEAPPVNTVTAAYRGTYKGYKDNSGKLLTFTLGENTLTWTGAEDGSWSAVYTTGGGDMAGMGMAGTWAYLYKGAEKQGFVYKIGEDAAFYSGTTLAGPEAALWASRSIAINVSDIAVTASNFVGGTNIATTTEDTGSAVNGCAYSAKANDDAGRTYYKLSISYDVALSTLNTKFGTSKTTNSGQNIHQGTTVSTGTDWVIFESGSDQVRLVQDISGTKSGVQWNRLY